MRIADHLAYKPSFRRHLHHLVINGFYAHDLDVDDLAFLEYVKARGVANGSLPNSGAVLLEELEFWQLPYGIAPDIERRIGPYPRLVATAEQRAMMQAKLSARRAQRVISANEKAIADAELAREIREWQKAQEQRATRQALSDAEWEAAAPKPIKLKPRRETIGGTVGRYHVPQWKLDEQREKAAAEAQEKERKRRQKIIKESRKTVERLKHLKAQPPKPPTEAEMRQAILNLVKGSHPTVWTAEGVARVIGCEDLQLVHTCLSNMVRDGLMRRTYETP